MKQQEWVWLARIRRPQGRKGEVFADLLTDFPEKFAQRRRLWLVADEARARPVGGAAKDLPRAVELVAHWLHKGGVVLHFAGVDSINQAEELAGLIVAIQRAARAQLGEGEAYISDLVGCTLIDVAGANPIAVGEIEDVDRSMGSASMDSAPLLVVRSAAGEVLVPFAKVYLRKIDLDGRRVEMALPEGLVELNNSGQ
jgi:16S rRNA processing protein RimM